VVSYVWEPSLEGPVPVILLSHGTGGASEDLSWLAEPLRDAGYLVAAVDHHGNSYNDEYLVEGFAFLWERARDITLVLDHLSETYNVDKHRIGAAGFSLGGYTVAALMGARLNGSIVEAIFNGVIPAPEVPEFPQLINTLRAAYLPADLAALVADGSGSFSDDRIRAGFLMAPGAGELIDSDSLRSIAPPLEVRWGDSDDNCPPDRNALVYLRALPNAQGHSVGAEIGHYVFLGDRPDPSNVRGRTADDAIEFFDRSL
jgi:predicted dienelactone hydrolase